jgi:DNA-binding transcriptional ArsR family regulator
VVVDPGAGAGAGRPGLSTAPPPDGAGVVFDALADTTRRDVLRAVAEDGPLTATELAGRLPVTRQAVSKHLEVLRAAGLVTSSRSGRDVRFSFQREPLDDAVAWIAAVGARWDRRLAALQHRVERPGEP